MHYTKENAGASSKLRMPAEWEPHEATWLSWPKNLLTFPKQILPEVERAYVNIVDALHKHEKVNIIVDDEQMEARVRGQLEQTGTAKNVSFYRIKTGDVWIRDYGPIFVFGEKSRKNRGKHNEIKVTKWRYNAYGDKYDDLKVDDFFVDKLMSHLKFEILKTGIVLEGGSVDVNGKGTLITSEQCLLNKNRNSQLTRKQIEQYLSDYLGASHTIWLTNGISGDDTDGHIDDFARFIGPNSAVCAVEDDKNDENYNALKKNFELLKEARDQNGDRIEVTPLPMPKPVVSPYGRLPASYANFYIANNVVLLPVFKNGNDERTISVLQDAFPKRTIVPIYSVPLVWGFGGIHCITQQQPKQVT